MTYQKMENETPCLAEARASTEESFPLLLLTARGVRVDTASTTQRRAEGDVVSTSSVPRRRQLAKKAGAR